MSMTVQKTSLLNCTVLTNNKECVLCWSWSTSGLHRSVGVYMTSFGLTGWKASPTAFLNLKERKKKVSSLCLKCLFLNLLGWVQYSVQMCSSGPNKGCGPVQLIAHLTTIQQRCVFCLLTIVTQRLAFVDLLFASPLYKSQSTHVSLLSIVRSQERNLAQN